MRKGTRAKNALLEWSYQKISYLAEWIDLLLQTVSFFFGQKLSRRKKKTNLPKLSFFSSPPFFPVALSFPSLVWFSSFLRAKNLPLDPFPLKWQKISLRQKIGLIYRRKNYRKSGIYVYNSRVFESEKTYSLKRSKQGEKSNIKLGNEPLYHELRSEKKQS